MGSIFIELEGNALKRINDVCRKNDISYKDFVQDALGAFFWLLEEAQKGNGIYSEAKSSTHRKELSIIYHNF
jgi:hypothetical protein